MRRDIFITISLLWVSSQSLAAEYREIQAGPEYQAGTFKSWLLGSHWRDLWAVPMHVPVLDLHSFAGGLKVLKRGGGMQTAGLRFLGADGKQYKFRSINKDASRALPPELHDTLLSDVVQDQISSALPLAPLVVDEFAGALGINQTTPTVVVLPDDPLLGKFQKEFANRLGTLEENPSVYDDGESTFEDVDKVKSTFNLFKRMESDPGETVDSLAYLRVRLMDMFIGDWDRHQKQWRWARTQAEDGAIWRPIARDRDQAFCRLDGLFPWISSYTLRQLNGVTESYPRIEALTWSGRYVDRRLLNGLTKEEWETETKEVLKVLTDPLIESAVNRLPREMVALEGAKLKKVLRARRDHLYESSMEFYQIISGYIDLRGTEGDEYVHLEPLDKKHLKVSLFKIKHSTGEPKKHPYFEKVFNSDDTHEIRFHRHGGDDRIDALDSSKSNIAFRIVPDELDRQLAALPDDDRFAPPRDYGYDWWSEPLLKYGSDQGLLVGGGPILYHYDIGDFPYVYKMKLIGGYAFFTNLYYLAYSADFPVALRPFRLQLDAHVSELEVQSFFGYGNDTVKDNTLFSQNYYKHVLQSYVISPTLTYGQDTGWQEWVSPGIKLMTMNTPDNNLIAQGGGVGQASMLLPFAQVGIQYATKNYKNPEDSSVFGSLLGSYYPGWLDNPNDFEKIRAKFKGTVALPLLKFSSFSIRGGGEKVVSSHPFFESAFLGGDENLRGYVLNRFAGELSIYGGAEARLYLTRFKVLFPAKLGLTLFDDLGRVYVANDSSTTLHNGYGVGIWTTWIKPENIFDIYAANSSEGTVVGTKIGFGF